MMEESEKIKMLAKEFKDIQKILTAIGDENRLYLMIEMMQLGSCGGARVGEITEKTHLSRPAISHHLQILKEAGIINVRKEGTKNYYYFDSSQEAMKKLVGVLQDAITIASSLPKPKQIEW